MTSPEPQPEPPSPERRPHVLVTHGDERVDDWYWLRERDSAEVIAQLEAENAYTEATLAHLAPLRRGLFEEIKARIQQTDASAPFRDGEWWYYTRQIEGCQYPVRCRKPYAAAGPQSAGGPEGIPGDEVVMLDENLEAAGRDYFFVGSTAVSPDGRWFAWSSDTAGNERFELRIRDLLTGQDLDDCIRGISYGLAWADDNQTVFYVTADAAERPYRVWRHTIGDSPAGDVLVYEEADERFRVSVERMRSGAFLQIGLWSTTTTEAWLVPTTEPAAEPRLIAPRRSGVEYDVDHSGEWLWIVTNDGARDFRLVKAPVDHPTPENWIEVVPERAGSGLLPAEAFATHVVLHENRDAGRRIRVLDLATGAITPIEAAEEVSATHPDVNRVFDSRTYRFAYTSLITPRSVYDYDVDTGSRTLVRREPVLGGYEPADYVAERRWATAADGTRVPVSLVRHRDRGGLPAPCVLYGYGSYETCSYPAFNPLRLPWLDRGGVFAIAHVRGGGEMGRAWYEEGKLEHKTNTFTDFIACAEKLIEDRVTSPEKLVARGASAGGLLMGAIANLRPDLFRAIVAQVPFVDCVTTMLDPSIPLTVVEYDEWGNPNDPKYYELMKAYSPYDNVSAQTYPRMLVTAGLNDPRVAYWEPAKWVAKLRALKTGDERVLLRTQMGAGHGGPSGRYSYWEEEAFTLAFMLDAVGAA